MHVPMGVSGVQAVPNTLHSQGLMTPLSTSPHWQAFGSATRTPGIGIALLGVEGREPGRSLRALWEMKPEPAPLEVGPQLEHLGQDGQRPGVSLLAHHPGVLVLHLAAPFSDLGQQHGDGLEDVERLEPGRDQGLVVLGRHEPVGPLADHRGHVARGRETRRGADPGTRGWP